MYIVDVVDDPTNDHCFKRTFEFKNYIECANFIQLVVNLNKYYACIVSYEPNENMKEGE